MDRGKGRKGRGLNEDSDFAVEGRGRGTNVWIRWGAEASGGSNGGGIDSRRFGQGGAQLGAGEDGGGGEGAQCAKNRGMAARGVRSTANSAPGEASMAAGDGGADSGGEELERDMGRCVGGAGRGCGGPCGRNRRMAAGNGRGADVSELRSARSGGERK